MKRKLTDNVVISKVCLFPKKPESVFSPIVFDLRKNIAFWKISRLRHVVLRVKHSVDKDEYGELVE